MIVLVFQRNCKLCFVLKQIWPDVNFILEIKNWIEEHPRERAGKRVGQDNLSLSSLPSYPPMWHTPLLLLLINNHIIISLNTQLFVLCAPLSFHNSLSVKSKALWARCGKVLDLDIYKYKAYSPLLTYYYYCRHR